MTRAEEPGGAPGRRAVRDYLICLSLANLHFVNAWLEVGNRGFDYFRATRPAATTLWALVTLVLLLSAAFWATVQLWRRLPDRWARPVAIVGIALSVLVPVNVMHKSVLASVADTAIDMLGRQVVHGLAALVGGALFVWLVARTADAARAYGLALSVMLPLAPVLAMQAAWVQWQRPSAESYAGTVPQQPGRPTPARVVVMIFDEGDQRLAIDERPGRVKLPALDRLLAQSFHASQAAGGGYLGVASSITSMLTGQRLPAVEPRSLGVQLHADRRNVIDPASAWVNGPTLFSELHRRGWSSSVIGWYIPYCRLLGQHLRECSWQAGGSVYGRREFLFEPSYPEAARTLAVRQLERVPLSRTLGLDRSQQERRRLQAEELTRIEARLDTALDSADLVYVHWPVPHPFGVEDRFSPIAGRGRAPNYLDNLAVMDRLLADVEARLTRAGRWDRTTLVVTSDHSLRSRYWRDLGAWTDEEQRATAGRQTPYVPFVVKFAGDHAARRYDKPFTIALLYDVVLAITDEVVSTPAELAAWLDANRGKHPTDVSAYRRARVPDPR